MKQKREREQNLSRVFEVFIQKKKQSEVEEILTRDLFLNFDLGFFLFKRENINFDKLD
jgi:hypothetical protein